MFSCEKCGKAYSRKHELKRHGYLKHGNQPPLGRMSKYRYACVYCPKTYTRIQDVKRHCLIKHPGKPVEVPPTKVPQTGAVNIVPPTMDVPRTMDVPQTSAIKEVPQTGAVNRCHNKVPPNVEVPQTCAVNIVPPTMDVPRTMDVSQTRAIKEGPQTGAVNRCHNKVPRNVEVPQTGAQTTYPQLPQIPGRTQLNATKVIPDVREPYMVFKHPFTMLVVGPSGCGKTYTVLRILQHKKQMIDQDIDEILWYHGQQQDLHNDIAKMFPNVRFIEGLPDSAYFDARKTRICILDDLMTEISGNVVANLFSKGSHHTNTSVICILQNLFPKNKEQRDISLNTKYILAFKNPRDGKQIGVLASQMDKFDLIKQAYKHATTEPFGYLMIDLTQEVQEELRVRSKIFVDDQVHFAYLEEDSV